MSFPFDAAVKTFMQHPGKVLDAPSLFHNTFFQMTILGSDLVTCASLKLEDQARDLVFAAYRAVADLRIVDEKPNKENRKRMAAEDEDED